MSVLVWIIVGLAFWHFAVLVPDRFRGGVIGALMAAVAGALFSGWLLPVPAIPTANPPGVAEMLWAIPGSLAALVGCWLWGKNSAKENHGP